MKYIKKYESSKFDQIDFINAVSDNYVSKVKDIMDNNPDVDFDFAYNQGYTPLLYAVLFNCNDVLKLLIDWGADVNKLNDKDDSALIIASTRSNLKTLKILIDAGVNWNHVNRDQNSPHYNRDFIFYLSSVNKQKIIKKYPEKYKDYLIKKDVEKYNL